jgi:hypothetical protein
MDEFYHNFTDLEQIGNLILEAGFNNKTDILRQAENILKHNFPLFGCKAYNYDGKIVWDNDPLNGKRWILFRNKPLLLSLKKNKDIKFIWELNRHQHLYYLGKAFILTKDRRYADEIIAEITNWIENVRPGKSVNWLSALEISIRVFSWIWALNFIDWQNSADRKTVNRIEKSIFEQTEFVEKHLQIREFSNNHLIGEVACLTVVGIMFPHFATSGSWLKKGLTILDEQINKQIFEDGVDKEQAMDYHKLVLDFYTFVVILCNKNDILVPKGLLNKLEKMYEALFYSSRPDGSLPMIGDDDNGRVAKLSEDSGRNLLSTLLTGAILFSRGDMKWLVKKFNEESLWLLGLKGYGLFNSLTEYTPKYTSFGLKESGQYIMRSGWDKDALYMYFDCGPQGMGQAGHGHADALSFELFAYGKPLIIDSGTYTYNGPKEWRNYFRGTSGHNTVVIDGLDQAEHLKPYDQFGWEKKADAYNTKWYSTKKYDFVGGYHDGYKRLHQPVRHKRYILFVKPEYWIITDFLMGEGKHNVEILYHFSPGEVFLDKDKKSVKTNYKNESNILVIPSDGGNIKAQIIEGNIKPIQGWVSYNYGDKVKVPTLSYSKVSNIPLIFTTVLYPFKEMQCPTIDVKKVSIDTPQTECLKIQIGGVKDHYLISASNSVKKSFLDFQTDATMLYLRTDPNNKISKIMFKNGSYLLKNNDSLIKLEKTVLDFETEYIQ